MLKLTRGISLHLDRISDELVLGEPTRLDLTQVPMTLWVSVLGSQDPQTGQLVNVREINRALANSLPHHLGSECRTVEVLDFSTAVLIANCNNVDLVAVRLDITEQTSIACCLEDKQMIQITTKYQLAASHRLRRAEWSDKQNLEVFGKCSNPAGHGHNYVLEVTVLVSSADMSADRCDLVALRGIVEQRVVNRFDHKNLNDDTEEFATLMPTVENMARVFWDALVGRFGAGELYRVGVWETPMTYAEYFGERQRSR